MQFPLTEKMILTVVTWEVRCTAVESLRQRTAFTDLDRIQHAIRNLSRKNLIEVRSVVALVYELKRPIFTSDRLQGVFDVGHIAWQFAERWAKAERRRVQVVWATRNAVRLMGGCSGRYRQPLQLQHDLGVAEILAVRGACDNETWISEDAYRLCIRKTNHGKVPDAVILDPQRKIQRVIEFGGRYSKAQISKFHSYWTRRRIPYELW